MINLRSYNDFDSSQAASAPFEEKIKFKKPSYLTHSFLSQYE